MTATRIPLPPQWDRLGTGFPNAGAHDLAGLVAAIPESWLKSRRWFGGKTRRINRLALADEALLEPDPRVVLALVEVHYAQGPSDLYALPLLFTKDGVLDALEDSGSQCLFFNLIAKGAKRGPLSFGRFVDLPPDPAAPCALAVEQSNTSIAYGRDWILKHFRKIVAGLSRDLEVGRFLTQEAGFSHTPLVAGCVSYAGQTTLAILQEFVPNEGDGWTWLREQLEPPPNAPDDLYWAQDGLPARPHLLDQVELLGAITGQMHRALASRSDVPGFAPEACIDQDAGAWWADLEAQRLAALAACRETGLPDDIRRVLEQVLGSERKGKRPLVARGRKIQIHGDYHLGQVLKTAQGFVIIDFEGEPARPLAERRAKQPPLKDVAGMLRSLHYAAWSIALAAPDGSRDAWAEVWPRDAGKRFLAGWQHAFGEEVDHSMLALFQLTKAFYELNYELNNRPGWVGVPLRGMARLAAEVGL